MRKLLCIIAVASLILAGASLADDHYYFSKDGDIYRYFIEPVVASGETAVSRWSVKYAKSIDRGISFGAPRQLVSFSREAEVLGFSAGSNSAFNLLYSISGEVFLLNGGRPQFITAEGESYILARSAAGKKLVAWEKDGNVAGAVIENESNIASYFNLAITGETLSRPAADFDQFDAFHLIFSGASDRSAVHSLYYLNGPTAEVKTIDRASSFINDKMISAAAWGPLIVWKSDAGATNKIKAAASLDQGMHFSLIEETAAPFFPLDLAFSGGKWAASFLENGVLGHRELSFPLQRSPGLPARSVTRAATPEVAYTLNNQGPVLNRIELSYDSQFGPDHTYVFERLVQPTAEARYAIPFNIPDARYYLRISSFNGISSSPFSPVSEFVVDRTAPSIAITSPSAEAVEEKIILILGNISEKVDLRLNHRPITQEASGAFLAEISLQPGANSLLITATDEAGNTSAEVRTITFTSLRPQLKILRPREDDWYKPGSSIFVEAEVFDLQNDVSDEEEASVTVSGIVLSDRPVYDQKEGRVSGFITLPANLPDGKLDSDLRLADSAGHAGNGRFKVNVDNEPPVLLSPAAFFSNSPVQISLPVADSDAGLDPAGTIFYLSGISLEGVATIENRSLVIKNFSSLADGTYEVTVIARDIVGNTARPGNLKLIVDTAAPVLTILSTFEPEGSRGQIRIEGRADDPYLDEIKISINRNPGESFAAHGPLFTKEISLLPGLNNIAVEAVDLAGNRTVRSFSVSNYQTAASILNGTACGPSPFSPVRDGQAFITAALLAPANLRLYILDLGGTLIYKKDFLNVPAGNWQAGWSGRDQFSRLVDNGVYPYILLAESAGSSEIRRGKILKVQ